jgi:hypothetical protein
MHSAVCQATLFLYSEDHEDADEKFSKRNAGFPVGCMGWKPLCNVEE